VDEKAVGLGHDYVTIVFNLLFVAEPAAPQRMSMIVPDGGSVRNTVVPRPPLYTGDAAIPLVALTVPW
jgi:hypothetical protein